MICPKCNKKLPDGAKFCTGCGTSLEGIKDSSQKDDSSSAVQKKPENKKNVAKGGKKKMSPILFIVIAAAVIFVLYLLGNLYIKHLSDEYVAELGDVYRMLTDTNSNNDKEAEQLFKQIGEPKDYYSYDAIDFYRSIISLFVESYETRPEIHEDILDGVYRIFDGPTNPTEYEIIDRLSKVDSITGIEAVSEKNDANGRLNQRGWYTADIFFSHKGAKKAYAKKNDKTVAEVGTIGGGSVEIYTTFNDAVKRCNLLDLDRRGIKGQKEAIVGTCVVRVSQYLSEEEQNKLIEDIAAALYVKEEPKAETESSGTSDKQAKEDNTDKTENTEQKKEEKSSEKEETKEATGPASEIVDNVEALTNDDQYYTQGCRLVKQGGDYYLFPIYSGESIIRVKTFEYKSFPNGKGYKIASNAVVGIATSVEFTETIYGTEYPTFEYKSGKFYDVVDDLLSTKHWQTLDMGYGPDTLAFEVDGSVIMNLMLINFNDDGEITQLMDFYTE